MTVDILDELGIESVVPKGFSPEMRRLVAGRAFECVGNALEGRPDLAVLAPLYARGAATEAVGHIEEARTMTRILSAEPQKDLNK